MNFVQATSNVGGFCDFIQDVTFGNLLIILVTTQNLVQWISCADSLNNPYGTLGIRQTMVAGTDVTAQVFFTRSKATGPNRVTPSSDAAIDTVVVHEVSGANTLDKACFSVGVGLALDSGPIATTKKNSFLFGYGAIGGAAVNGSGAGSGWIPLPNNPAKFLTQYQIVTDLGVFNSTQIAVGGKGGSPIWIEEIMAFFDADFHVGDLYPQNIAYPPPQQPGGSGTPVTDPKQQIGPTTNTKPDLLFPINEFSGRFRPGCGHSINSYEVAKAAVGGVASALILCPICKYIVRIITPYDLVHDNLINPYIIG